MCGVNADNAELVFFFAAPTGNHVSEFNHVALSKPSLPVAELFERYQDEAAGYPFHRLDPCHQC